MTTDAVALLPTTVRVIIRDWLNANNIVLLGQDDNVLIDTGYVSHARETLALLRRSEHLGDRPLHLIVNTHCHSDHMGANATLARAYECPVVVPQQEAPLIRSWMRARCGSTSPTSARSASRLLRSFKPAIGTVGVSSGGRRLLHRVTMLERWCSIAKTREC
ncbi:MAG: hypothetical protein C5B46_06690 [Proteobacteria bacterium]|nr:MAG: hypothetical protein C5B46_06690 [Pseudomonadota bacterium]